MTNGSLEFRIADRKWSVTKWRRYHRLIAGVYIGWAKKTAPLNSSAETSAKRWPIIVKFATRVNCNISWLIWFLSISAEKYTNTNKSDAIGITIMHTDMTQSRIQRTVIVSVGISRMDKNRFVIIEPKWTVYITVSTCYPIFVEETSPCGPCSRTVRRHTLPRTPWRTCDVSTSRSLSLRAWNNSRINQSTTLFGAPLNRRRTATSDDSLQSRSSSMWYYWVGNLSRRFIDRAINEWHSQPECAVQQ